MYGGKDAQWAKRVAASWEDETMEYEEAQDEQLKVRTDSALTYDNIPLSEQ